MSNAQKYSVNQEFISTVLSWVGSGEIVIPEIQRSFVWKKAKVRDLLDSLYWGYPIGYLIGWRNPHIRLKDGSLSQGRKILIDGQQRVVSLQAAILGQKVMDKNYRKERIQIAFHPIQEKFEVFNPAIAKDRAWIGDIHLIIAGESLLESLQEYLEKNPEVDRRKVGQVFERLRNITQRQLGYVELAPELDIETVTQIFIRINSEGVQLNEADFAMSKMAANSAFGGHLLRKCVDYFSHLSSHPDFYHQIEDVDKEFAQTAFYRAMAWLKDERENLYKPGHTDILRVAFTSEFNRGRLADLVSLLSGRNFETRTYEEKIAVESFSRLEKGLLQFINETNFQRFLMILKSAGFVDTRLIRSQNNLNFAYILYLKLKSKNYPPAEIESFVRRWYVLSVLKGRYVGSPESQFDKDIKMIEKGGFREFLENQEKGELSHAFWEVALVEDHLVKAVRTSPAYNVYLAAQARGGDKGFLSRDISVRDLLIHKGDRHHIFPKKYLQKQDFQRGQYNQIANYVYMQAEINIQIKDRSPRVYFGEIKDQCKGGESRYGNIRDLEELKENLRMNCIPEMVMEQDISGYEEFLKERRKLMAGKLKEYYFSL